MTEEEKNLTPNLSEEPAAEAPETEAQEELKIEQDTVSEETTEPVTVEEETPAVEAVSPDEAVEEAADPEVEEISVSDEAQPSEAADDVSPATEETLEYRTELVQSGPLSEEIRVVSWEALKEAHETSYDDQARIYESSLKDISQEQRIIGKVVSIHEDEILMDIGFKSEGVVSRDEFEEGELPKLGEEIEVFVDVLEDENGQMILSKRKADFMRIWERIREIFSSNETIEGKIINRIKGGMVVDVMGVDAFLPGSQIDVRPVTDFDSYVGKTLEFRIVKLNELRKNIVLSRKEILEESLKEKRDELLSKIKVGDILTGRVKNITDFGVFIDLGGLDGLLHITDLSWGRVNHPREVVGMDEELTVKVIDYDPIKQRVSLGLKQLMPHPWEGIETRYPVGSVVTGKVVNIANYGVFLELEKGVEGLIHISEISWTQHIKHPSEVFTLGDSVEAKVLNIDGEERKISLGYKQLEPDPWESIDTVYEIGSTQKGIIRNLTTYGAFIELQEGIDGFVHISDLSWTRKIRHPREVLHRGDEIEVKVLDISKDNRKISLGIKQLENDPWPLIGTTYIEGAIVEGEVARITDKLLVVKLEYGLEGIVPLGQMPKKDRKDVSKKVKIGEVMQLKVLEVNPDDKKLVLSRDQAIPKKPKTEVEAYMMKQEDAVEKMEIPEAIIEKIAESEKAVKTEKKPKAKAKKKVVEEEPELEAPAETEEKKVEAGEPEAKEAKPKKAAPKATARKKTTKTAKADKKSDEDKKEDAETAGTDEAGEKTE